MNSILKSAWDYVAGLGRGFGQGWNRFWFQPSDPATLAMIRICVGLVLCYAYGTILFETQNLIGPHAWFDSVGVTEMEKQPEVVRVRWYAELGAKWLLKQSADKQVEILRSHNLLRLDQISEDNPPDWLQQLGQAYYRQIPEGYKPIDPSVFAENFHTSIYYYVKSEAGIWIVYSVFLLACVCMTLGLGSRVACVLAWAGHISFIHRSQFTWFGMDSMLAFLTLYLIFAPTGAAFSLDRLIARYRNSRREPATKSQSPHSGAPVLRWDATVIVRMIQIHMCIVYFASGCAKLMGGTWWSGWAVWLTMNVPEFRLIDMSWIAHLPDWMVNLFSGSATLATILFEVGFPFLIYIGRLRPLLLFTAFMLHIGIGFFMGLGAFGSTMLTGLLAFVSPESVRWFVAIVTGTGREITPAATKTADGGTGPKGQGSHLKTVGSSRSA